ncbi:uncharacterized protein JN550_012112 [Neoarthrinium moseri]|uniref:uncharacterized protein n=1 Tax=Neoarthrinium moseri TaxID=1658444 RepID=UPI001FDC9121|nr:uncharacterized protein JN550_012112 [Neoarthrinium moseri]KAI1859303.1 hypothetical protein JN550_012112 [Neoarthrinium moseri]
MAGNGRDLLPPLLFADPGGMVEEPAPVVSIGDMYAWDVLLELGTESDVLQRGVRAGPKGDGTKRGV